jgi:hypothetical protein
MGRPTITTWSWMEERSGSGRRDHRKGLKDRFGHTPLSVNEDIPWSAGRLVIGTGANGSLPVMDEIEREAAGRWQAVGVKRQSV